MTAPPDAAPPLPHAVPRHDPPPKAPPHHLPFLTLVLLLLVSFIALHSYVRPWLSGRQRALSTFDRAFGVVLDEYVEPRQPDELVHRAIRGMIDSLEDRHSTFLSPSSNERQSQVEHGRYAGLGIVITLRRNCTLIQKVFPHTPAERAGLRPGDFIVGVDGQDLSRVETLETVSEALRGEEGSTVHLVVLRGGERIEVAVTRAVIRRPVVEYTLLAPGIGYAKVADFPDQVSKRLEDALADLKTKGARGLILDLRDNQGGFLDEAVRVADLFVADGLIVATRSRYPTDDHTFHAKPGGPAETLPMVVLVNQHSASAAEVVAGALQDHGRAQLVGSTTYGKGAVNKRFPLPDGSGLLLSTGRYYLPKGRQIEGKGLQPDVEVPPPSLEERERATPGKEPDPQRDKALAIMSARIARE